LGEASNNDVDAENYGGWFSASGGLGRGVYGQAGGENGHGVHGTAFGSSGVGVYGYSTADTGYGGYFLGPNATGIYAKGSPTGYAAEFQGNVIIRDWSTGSPIIELGEGLDYAEGFEVSTAQAIEPGSVLVIDPDNAGKLTLATEPYDCKVAGIVAGAGGLGSGVRLGSDEFDYDVALAGRVYCNVDATEEAVEPGDLLTTSASPGYAMKVTDYERAQGAILGKAMESLEKGEKGQILVLVTLQ